jgi:DNA methyltransferase 1-associated protein 1
MSDVRFILGISPEEKAGPNAVNRKKRKFEVTSDTKNKKKKTGLAREVANLAIQGSTGALFKIDEPVVAEKPKIHRPNRWIQMPISSTANRQFLSKHWTKANEKPGDYYFAKYSKKNLSIKYTDQEYRQQFHQGKDNVDNWTKEETDYLVEQCDKFECKFIVIKDRWNFNGPYRSVEDIKARFYFIREKLERLHYGTLERNPFDKEKEILRKKQIEILNNRTLATQKEEESLLPRYSSLMAAFKEHQSESKKIIKLAQNTLQTKKKKNNNNRVTPTKSGQSKDLSSKILKYSGAIQSALSEMGIQKPNASDTAGLQKYSDMRSDICILLELQRIEAEALYELQVLKGHKAMLANTDIPIVSIDPFLPDVNVSLLPVTFGQPGNEEYEGDMGEYEEDYEQEGDFSEESDYGEEDYDVLR